MVSVFEVDQFTAFYGGIAFITMQIIDCAVDLMGVPDWL